jgi:cell volume regulation protein A
VPRGRPTLLTVRPAADGVVDGDLAHPRGVLDEPVVAQLRIRRDTPGALVALADGRYAVTGPLIVIGGRQDITQFATRRMRRLQGEDPERAWLQNVIGAMASDLPE